MAEPIPVPLGLSSAYGRTPAEGGTRLINCYASSLGEEARHQYPVYAVDGFDAFASITGTGTGAIRGGFPLSASVLYVVSGTRVVSVSAAGSPTLLTGTVAASGHVTMARNRKEPNAQVALAIASTAGNLYFIENGTLTEFTLADIDSGGTLLGVTAIDGYFVILMSNGEFFITAIDNSTIDELDFAKAEANPDGGVAIAVLGTALIIFGNASTEFWSNTGATDFPFERNQTRSYGCYAAGSVQNLVQTRSGSGVSDTLVFAATDSKGAYLGVCLMEGTEPVKISSPQLDRAIIADGDPTLIRSETWSNGERSFYYIHGSNFSFGYDFSTGLWHERVSDGIAFWRGANAFTFGTQIIVGDYALAELYVIQPDLYSAVDPCVLTLKHSNDGGQTWVTRTPREIGDTADQSQRARFNRIGRGKSRGKTFEISISQAVMENGVGLPMTILTPTVHAWPHKVQMAAAHIDIVPGVSLASRAKGVLAFALQTDLITEQAH
jgi:hypothetical protein